jgi:cytochrome c oxidase subunit 4
MREHVLDTGEMESGVSSHPSTATYVRVFVALMILLAITVGLAELELGGWNLPAAAAVASIKAVLIVLFFMHVRYSNPLVWLLAAAGFVWLALLFGLTLCDYLTRPAI